MKNHESTNSAKECSELFSKIGKTKVILREEFFG